MQTSTSIKAGCVVALVVTSLCVRGQDLGDMKGRTPVSFHGSIGGGASFYHSNEAYPTRDPFAWNLYGNFTPSFYGFSLPFSFVITQYSKSYLTPFTQFGISPSYKWIKLHLGYRSIAFSPLVFDGQSFLGGGLELSPKGFYFAAFYGRLNKAISEDTTYGHVLEPQYARTGYGLKIGVGGTRNNISFQFFHAKDDSGSIRRINDSLSTVRPQENSVVGASWRLTFFRRLTFTGDAAASVLNRDQSYERIDSIGYWKIPKLAQQFMPINWSTVVSYSGQAQLSLILDRFNFSAGYRRVQPDFKSLGVPYALDDVEMISGNAGANLYKGRLNINAAYTGQHNDLEHMLSSRLVTRTGNLSLNTYVDQHLNINLTVTGVRVLQEDGLAKLNDSARLNQLMGTATLSPSLNFSGQRTQHTISGSVSYTKLDDRNPATTSATSADNINTSLDYSLFFTRGYWGLNCILTYSQYGQQNSTYKSMGVNGGVNAQLLHSHSLSVQGSVGYFVNQDNGSPVGNNMTFSFNCNYGVLNHSLGVYMSYVITPPVNLNPLNIVNHVPYAVNSKNLVGGVTYAYHF
ncbi:MAG TPA: hypothetical protein VHD83_06995 [Puia sp.]|nr:hypothetical protein [Puia sp.]